MPLPFLTLMAAIPASAVVGLIALTFRPTYRAARASQMSRSVGLSLDESVRPAVERSIATRMRATGTGALVGIAGGWLGVTLLPSGTLQQWLLVSGMFLGIGVGSAVGAFLARPRPAVDGARVARSRDVSLSDYVMPFELTGARILIAVAAATAAIVAVLLSGNPRETTAFISLVVVTLLAVAALVVFEVVGRAIVAQASPAQDPASLAWEDALRAEALRNLVTAPLTFGCIAVMLTVVGAFGALPLSALSIVLGTAVPVLVAVGVVVVSVMSLVRKPQQHFLRILWPETAAAATEPHATGAR